MRIVHTADSHLGIQVAKTPIAHREGRERRDQAIWENFIRVIGYACEVEADLFIHSGDLFDKAYAPPELIHRWAVPLIELSRKGIPVVIIPGNHERSEFPFDLFHGAPNVYVFHEPRSISLRIKGYSVACAGFPFLRENSRETFFRALKQTEYESIRADINVLVTHQAFDGSVVGPNGYTFTTRRTDTVSRALLPTDFHYVAAGHIHRHQVLPHPMDPSIPIAYPGSIQRMSFAEMDEPKGFIEAEAEDGRIHTRFRPLPAHDMEVVEIEASGMTPSQLREEILGHSWRCHSKLILKFLIRGWSGPPGCPSLGLDELRNALSPVLECQFAFRRGKRWVLK